MYIKNKKQLKQYQEVCDISVAILDQIKDFVKAGIMTIEIDNYATQLCIEHNVTPAFKGASVGNAPSYIYTTCTSINDTIVHGIPSEELIKPGDIVKVDFGIIKNGYYTDHCFTLGIEPLSQEKKTFITESRNAVLAGVDQAIEQNTIGDIGYAIESYAKTYGYTVVTNFVGHSIGKSLHEQPDVPAYGNPKQGESLKKGLLLCIEAQILEKSDNIYISSDNWTVKSQNATDACMFEYIVMVEKKKPKILTDTRDWKLFV